MKRYNWPVGIWASHSWQPSRLRAGCTWLGSETRLTIKEAWVMLSYHWRPAGMRRMTRTLRRVWSQEPMLIWGSCRWIKSSRFSRSMGLMSIISSICRGGRRSHCSGRYPMWVISISLALISRTTRWRRRSRWTNLPLVISIISMAKPSLTKIRRIYLCMPGLWELLPKFKGRDIRNKLTSILYLFFIYLFIYFIYCF